MWYGLGHFSTEYFIIKSKAARYLSQRIKTSVSNLFLNLSDLQSGMYICLKFKQTLGYRTFIEQSNTSKNIWNVCICMIMISNIFKTVPSYFRLDNF